MPFRVVVMTMVLVCSLLRAEDNAGVQTVLDRQVQAWNAGNVDAFVETYSNDCVFVGKEILQGRDRVRSRYRKTYPSPKAMGHLSFREIQTRRLDENTAIAYGVWRLDRDQAGGGPVGGKFSLVLRRRQGKWLIVLDHTS